MNIKALMIITLLSLSTVGCGKGINNEANTDHGAAETPNTTTPVAPTTDPTVDNEDPINNGIFIGNLCGYKYTYTPGVNAYDYVLLFEHGKVAFTLVSGSKELFIGKKIVCIVYFDADTKVLSYTNVKTSESGSIDLE